jgi:hypothetical protein
MQTIKHPRLFSVLVFIILLGTAISAQGQWGPPGGQQAYPPQYQSQSPSYPPQQQQQYPHSQSAPPSQAWAPPSGGGQSLSDALGRFRINLPQGAVPMGATYNFSLPAAMCQVSIMTVTQDQVFQMQQQNFPGMLRQMGATIDTEQPMDVKGRPARFIAYTMRDQNSGMSMHSMNAFISAGGLWVQVMGPEQNVQQISEIFNSVLAGLQF